MTILTPSLLLLLALSADPASLGWEAEVSAWSLRHVQKTILCLNSWEISIEVEDSGLVTYRATPIIRTASDPTQPESHRFQLSPERVRDLNQRLSSIDLEAERCGALPPPPVASSSRVPARSGEQGVASRPPSAASSPGWDEPFQHESDPPLEGDWGHDIVFSTSGNFVGRENSFLVDGRTFTIANQPEGPCRLQAIAQELVAGIWDLVEAQREADQPRPDGDSNRSP